MRCSASYINSDIVSLYAGLYGERVGALSFILSDDGAAKRVLSQLKRIARAIYSNPPVHGARIVAEVVGNEDMFTEWKEEMDGIAGRIQVSTAYRTCTMYFASPSHQKTEPGMYVALWQRLWGVKQCSQNGQRK